MLRFARWILGGTLAAGVAAPTRPNAATVATHEFIVVYVGVDGVDGAMAGLADSVRLAFARRAAGVGQQLSLRGVSRDPEITTGIRDLALVGPFNEISVGGNWANSAVVHYLGADMGAAYPKARVPQVIVLERDIDNQLTALHVGPERELARYVGAGDIWNWARRGAPLSK